MSLKVFYVFASRSPCLETDATRMCALLVGLPDVRVVAVGEWPLWLRVEIETTLGRPTCPSCHRSPHDHGTREVMLVDLPVFGRPARLVWRKHRWRCPNRTAWSDREPVKTPGSPHRGWR